MLQTLFNIISPECCILCNNQGDVLCNECKKSVPTRVPACFWCNTLTKNGRTCIRCKPKTYIYACVIPFRLQPPLNNLIYQLKYDGGREVAKFLAIKLADSIKESEFEYLDFVVTSVPTTGKSYRNRSYNQADLIAKALALKLKLPHSKLLIRTHHTDQIGLTRNERLKSVENSFIPTTYINNQQILLVDDVLTTGATANACAKALKQAGAKRVVVVAACKK